MKTLQKFLLEEIKGISIFRAIKPETYLDIDFKNEAKSEIIPQISATSKTVLFNLENAELINSHGVSGFLSIFDELEKVNGVLAFCGVNAWMIKNAFQTSGINELCQKYICDTEEEAIALLSQTLDNN